MPPLEGSLSIQYLIPLERLFPFKIFFQHDLKMKFKESLLLFILLASCLPVALILPVSEALGLILADK